MILRCDCIVTEDYINVNPHCEEHMKQTLKEWFCKTCQRWIPGNLIECPICKDKYS